ncbi:glycoside hydrolase family 5 protein [Athelia psychrophila]|uniref:Glycoside hydrolase family 5 protein n=1 Tax=Athelia psychrophila TaxID=1759441 RepID=A0A167U2K4_9AGAM|nr:glycoside hydrolase family 5 protein [Fibularhizoctonia sp. CBS 109695]
MKFSSGPLFLAAVAFAPRLVDAFVKGVNQPWGNNQYGHWLSSSIQGYSAVYSSSDMAATFAAAKDIGAEWVRIWLFEAGQGLTIDGNKYVTGLKSDFETNFNDVLSHAAANGVKVYPTFFNFAPNTADFPIANFFTDSNAQTALLNNLIKPFIKTYGSNSNIAAFQLYNELNGIANPYFGSGYVINQAVAKTWVTSTTAAIKSVNSAAKVSVSQIYINDAYHAVGVSNVDYVGTGVDFYDIHIYSDNGAEIPAASAFKLDKPVYLGEFGESTGEGDSHQNDVIYNFFVAAKAGGWAGALYWNLGFAGSQPGVCGSDSTLKFTLYNCEGGERGGYNEFKYS